MHSSLSGDISIAAILARPMEGYETGCTAPSAPSSLDFGVEPFQFHAGVFDTKLPIDTTLFAVRLVRPGCNFSLQYGQCTDAAVA